MKDRDGVSRARDRVARWDAELAESCTMHTSHSAIMRLDKNLASNDPELPLNVYEYKLSTIM